MNIHMIHAYYKLPSLFQIRVVGPEVCVVVNVEKCRKVSP